MSTATTIPAAKAALLAAFNASSDLTGVRVTWEEPTDGVDFAREWIWLGDVHQDEHWGSVGFKRREEHYAVDVKCHVVKEGNDPQGTETRLWEVVEAIRDAIHTDPTLGGVVNRDTQVTAVDQASHPAEPQSWVCAATVTVEVKASLVG